MQRKTKRIIMAVAVIGLLAAGGAAFTSSSSLPNTVAGFATSTITGANANSMTYTLNTDGSAITAVNLVFTENLTALGTGHLSTPATIKSAFEDGPLNSNCTIQGAFDGTSGTGLGTHVLCLYDGVTTDPAPQLIAGGTGVGANTFNVAVTSN
jgi:hypothetical protein